MGVQYKQNIWDSQEKQCFQKVKKNKHSCLWRGGFCYLQMVKEHKTVIFQWILIYLRWKPWILQNRWDLMTSKLSIDGWDDAKNISMLTSKQFQVNTHPQCLWKLLFQNVYETLYIWKKSLHGTFISFPSP